MSEIKKSIYSKLLDFQSTIEKIKKDGANTFFKNAKGQASTYATLPAILAEVKPLLSVLKLVLTQPIKDGLVYTIITDSETGEQLESSIALSVGLNAQQSGSAITYFRRYTLSSLLSLEIDEDDDGNKATHTKAPEIKKEVVKPKAVLTSQQATDILNACSTLDILKKTFLTLTPEMQKEMEKLKDQLKTQLK